jgi:hypothetical protein
MTSTTGLRPLIEVLNRVRIPYLIGGSIAVMAHGLVRSTQDVDFLANLLPVHIKPFVESLQPDFYVDDTVNGIERAAKLRTVNGMTLPGASA